MAGGGTPGQRLRADLADHAPADDAERGHVATLLAALDEFAEPFDERAQSTHVTGSAIVLADDGSDRTVLVLHKRLERWLQPGGHVEPGEHVHDAALREVGEETGLAVRHPPAGPTLVHVHVHDGGRGHTHLDVRYLLLADPDQAFAPGPGESTRLGWFRGAEVAELGDGSVTAALASARRHGPASPGSPGSRGAVSRPRSDVASSTPPRRSP